MGRKMCVMCLCVCTLPLSLSLSLSIHSISENELGESDFGWKICWICRYQKKHTRFHALVVFKKFTLPRINPSTFTHAHRCNAKTTTQRKCVPLYACFFISVHTAHALCVSENVLVYGSSGALVWVCAPWCVFTYTRIH